MAPTQFGGPNTAWIEQRRRADRGLTARVFWRPGGCRDTPREWETFGAGSDAKKDFGAVQAAGLPTSSLVEYCGGPDW